MLSELLEFPTVNSSIAPSLSTLAQNPPSRQLPLVLWQYTLGLSRGLIKC